MGKGFNNYMCKKPFHPGSKANIKRAWMAEQKTENEKRKQEELKLQYEKEQELYHNRALLSKESKDKLGLNFMYEAPPGAKKEHQKEDNEPEYKFEWQRKYNAPREDFARGNAEIRDQPFGIQVRNVRCIKCHKWGHINTDKECPLYNNSGGPGDSSSAMDPSELMRRMKEEEGLALKQSILGHRIDPSLPNQQLLSAKENEEEDVEMQFLKSLSTKQKEKLLKKLEKLEKGSAKKSHKKKSKKKQKKKKTQRRSSSDSDDSESDVDYKKHIGKSKRCRKSPESDSSTDSSLRKEKAKHGYSRKCTEKSHDYSSHRNKSHEYKDRHREGYKSYNSSSKHDRRPHSPIKRNQPTSSNTADSGKYKKFKTSSDN